ncbi:MAG: adenylosuccinate lyase family protein, partial [Paracoccaceae bacterium]|nr:adenylosuccinate lyase family protein [Paracoccaceae bacterium]MDP5345185.1 adenylosuccinate lyase family protein [Paracoccaceae bacterium]
EDPLGLIHAEALSFALAETLPRPQAQARVKALCAEASATQTALVSLVQRDFPGRDWPALLTPAQQMGEAPAIARRFATAAKAAVGTR